MNWNNVLIGVIVGAWGSFVAQLLEEEKRSSSTSYKLGTLGIPKVRVEGVRNIDERVGNIINLINKYYKHPLIREYASRVLSKKCGNRWCVKEKDWYNEAKAIFNQVRRDVRYARDVYGIDTFVNPVRTLYQYKIADCDDYVITLGALYKSIGYPIKLVVVQTADYPDYNHIYLKVGIPPMRPIKWVTVDASENKPFGWEVPSIYVIKKKEYKVWVLKR